MKRIHIIFAGVGLILAVVLGSLLIPKKVDKNSPDEVEDFSLSAARKVLAEGDLIAAKELYAKTKENNTDLNRVDKIREEMEVVNMKIIFSTLADGCSIEYAVRPNDALSKIARKHKTTVNLIKRANNLKSDVIRPGQKLKVNICPFSVLVDKSQNLLFLKREGEVIKTYQVSTGKDNSTPVGEFTIINKLNKPTWYKTGAVIPPDSPENILGSRWMGFDRKGYGIHGTIEPEKLGEQITLGCVRMKNADVEELFDIVPTGSEIIIID